MEIRASDQYLYLTDEGLSEDSEVGRTKIYRGGKGAGVVRGTGDQNTLLNRIAVHGLVLRLSHDFRARV